MKRKNEKRKKETTTTNGGEKTRKKKKKRKNEKTLTRQKPWKKIGSLRILTKKITLVRILDEFENSFCDRRLGGHNVASRFVCVSVLPSLNHNENPLVVPPLLGKNVNVCIDLFFCGLLDPQIRIPWEKSVSEMGSSSKSGYLFITSCLLIRS